MLLKHGCHRAPLGRSARPVPTPHERAGVARRCVTAPPVGRGAAGDALCIVSDPRYPRGVPTSWTRSRPIHARAESPRFVPHRGHEGGTHTRWPCGICHCLCMWSGAGRVTTASRTRTVGCSHQHRHYAPSDGVGVAMEGLHTASRTAHAALG